MKIIKAMNMLEETADRKCVLCHKEFGDEVPVTMVKEKGLKNFSKEKDLDDLCRYYNDLFFNFSFSCITWVFPA